MKVLLSYAVTLKVEPAGGLLTAPPVLTEPEFEGGGGVETEPELLAAGVVDAAALRSGVEAEIVITTNNLGAISDLFARRITGFPRSKFEPRIFPIGTFDGLVGLLGLRPRMRKARSFVASSFSHGSGPD